MKARNILLILALTLGAGFFGATHGLAYMRETYGGACGQLDGVPGILQRVNLLSMGNCVANGPKCDKVNTPCKITKPPTGTSAAGLCKQQNGACYCIPNSD
jgi:hypothetical protein